ncbi:hypothetical protein QLQ12_38990 [Actinoplanes sp. NEAU-A12]|uniref:Beta-ketoacyl synthase N-terminal domain-containing protein n=1 Tax=Actinoplanes sandaracinus TaxID=3045177 RepID=A0ABT6WXY1_9ACTN|nr:hypothetical protein [Actinoplanes sandaracinus]MDI6104594.1 hypothetical protein [Actinoplanes sandaracinus]
MMRLLAAAVAEPSARLAPLPGFVESPFSPLVFEACRRCLDAQLVDGARTAVVLCSLMGDTATADLASRRLVGGRVHNPLLFMQATANSVLGYLSREFGITGQQLSLSTLDDPLAETLAMADVLLDEPDLDRVLVVGVELAGGARVEAVRGELAGGAPSRSGAVQGDLAVAVLLGRDGGPAVPVPQARPGPPGSLRGLLDLARTTVGGTR